MAADDPLLDLDLMSSSQALRIDVSVDTLGEFDRSVGISSTAATMRVDGHQRSPAGTFAVRPELGPSPERPWRLHRQLSIHLTPTTLDEWRPTILRSLDRRATACKDNPTYKNLDRWQRLIEDGDLPGLRRAMTGLDTDSVQMREVFPMAGLLPQDERAEVLRKAS